MTNSDTLAAQLEKAVAHHTQGRFTEALALYDSVLALSPDNAPILRNRGEVLHRLGRLDEALENFEQAVRLKADFAEAHYARGFALHDLKRLDEALHSFEQAIAIRPDYVRAHIFKGLVLKSLRRLDEALGSFEAANTLQASAQTLYNMGIVLREMQRLEEALICFDQALKLNPNLAEIHTDKGTLLQGLNRLDEAQLSFDRALALNPDLVEAHWNKGLCSLLMGRFAEAWPHYEWRKKHYGPVVFPDYPKPLWKGDEDIRGKTLFIHFEQGLGDTIQFCRFARLAEARGAKVMLMVQAPLVRLMQGLSPTIQIVRNTLTPPPFDYYTPLLSLPRAFKTDLTNIPADIPYLRAEPARVAQWKARIGGEGFKIGIGWQGNKKAEIDMGRSFPLSLFESLSHIPGVRLISLQKHDGAEQLRELPAGMKVETLGEDFDAGEGAFVDSAAVMENMDLVITSDTAMAHLAGALGKPVWVALRHVPEWRWQMERTDSPWYPSMRLFRQPSRGDWQSVFAEMETELRSICTPAATPHIPMSWGELIDKITILEIKNEKIAAETAHVNVRRELAMLQKIAGAMEGEIAALKRQLKIINESLWDIEDRIRAKEAAQAFDAEFIALARSVYRSNDERGAVKRQINVALGSELIEEKSYHTY